MNYRVCLSSIGRFHFFALAVELAKIGTLEKIYTGYPAVFARRSGIPADRVASFPWFYVPGRRPGLRWAGRRIRAAYEDFTYAAHDRWVESQLRECDVFHGLSRYNLRAGKRAKRLGALYMCEVGSAHIEEQLEINEREFDRIGLPKAIYHSRGVERELAEYEAADRISVLSSFALNSFIRRGVPAQKLIRTPLGVDLSRFSPVEPRIQNVFRILFVGQISVPKGAHILVEAFQKACLRNSELVLAGGSNPHLRAALEKRNVTNLRFLGNVPNPELPPVYHSASVFVLPSFHDGFGMVVLEAMASGCPVIVSSNTGAADAVIHGSNGFIVPAGDVDAIVERLEFLYLNPDVRIEMGRRAAESAQRAYSWADYGEQMSTVYEELLHKKEGLSGTTKVGARSIE